MVTRWTICTRYVRLFPKNIATWPASREPVHGQQVILCVDSRPIKSAFSAPPAMLGLCPKLKSPPVLRGDNYSWLGRSFIDGKAVKASSARKCKITLLVYRVLASLPAHPKGQGSRPSPKKHEKRHTCRYVFFVAGAK